MVVWIEKLHGVRKERSVSSNIKLGFAQYGEVLTEVVLHPQVTLNRDADLTLADRLHEKAHQLCFIAKRPPPSFVSILAPLA